VAAWRFYSVALAGPTAGEVRDEIPLGEVTVTDRLKGVGSLAATIPLRHAKANRTNLETENTLIVAERDGVLQFAGPLLDLNRGLGDEVVGLGCDGMWNLVRRRVIRSSAGMTYGTTAAGEVRFSAVDQFRIVADLVAHMESISGGSLGITASYTALSGVTRDRTYEADKGKTIGEAIEQLADVENGFDWQLEPVGTVDSLSFVLRLSYPFRGRNTGYRFELTAPDVDPALPDFLLDEGGERVLDENGESIIVGRLGSVRSTGSGNILAVGSAESSRGRLSRVTAVGPGEGPAQLVRHAADPNLLGVLPLTEGSVAYLDVTNTNTLLAHARRSQSVDARASRLPVLRVDPNAKPTYGSYITGDIVHVTIDDGWDQFDGPARIVGRTITVDRVGRETVDLEVAELGRF